MDFPVVTIGIASYNNASYVRETLDSLIVQDYAAIQIVIVDDCSPDNSVQIIEEWLLEHPEVDAQFIRHPTNRGVCAVCNRILAESKGEFMCLVGSDDTYLPDRIRKQVQAFQDLGPEYAMCYSDVVNIDKDGNLLNDGRPVMWTQGHPEGEVFHALLARNFIPAMAQLVRVSVYRELGGFDESLSYEDWDMWLRIARQYRIKYVPGVVAKYRVHVRSAMTARLRALTESSMPILLKHLNIDRATDKLVHIQMAKVARELYTVGSPQAKQWLLHTWKWQPDWRSKVYVAMAGLGIPYASLADTLRKMRGVLDTGTSA